MVHAPGLGSREEGTAAPNADRTGRPRRRPASSRRWRAPVVVAGAPLGPAEVVEEWHPLAGIAPDDELALEGALGGRPSRSRAAGTPGDPRGSRDRGLPEARRIGVEEVPREVAEHQRRVARVQRLERFAGTAVELGALGERQVVVQRLLDERVCEAMAARRPGGFLHEAESDGPGEHVERLAGRSPRCAEEDDVNPGRAPQRRRAPPGLHRQRSQPPARRLAHAVGHAEPRAHAVGAAARRPPG
jgi:hypothetical protein